MTTAPELPPDLPAPAAAPRAPLHLVAPRPAGDDVTTLRAAGAAPDTSADEAYDDLDEVLRRATPRLLRYATRRLGDRHEAEEVVQEALLRAYQHRAVLAGEDDVMAWTTVVTGRLVIDRLRVRGRTTPVAELPATTRAARDTADVVVARDEARLALDALEAMPARQAAVLWAREVEGLSYDDIAARFDMSEPGVRSTLLRARRALRREYAARGGSLPGIALAALAPWLHGLRAAGRLRDTGRKLAGMSAVTVAGVGVIALLPASPWSHQDVSVPSHPAVAVRTAHSSPAAAPRATPTRHTTAVTRVATAATHSSTAARPAATSHTISGVPAVCGSAVGVNCHVHHSGVLYVGPRLPVTVADTDRIGVGTNNFNCSAVPTTPVTECDQPSSPTPVSGASR